ncbi:hypothetical protein [Magnetospirillum sp. UT-4]|uniref:hypothetical protein n=1 Tax=Magnetospirillum sp. UT-4 TaxID=2681467 RepID=UPI00137E37A9|nr:hypothetical protein [Magnetospirillum sp. UT-4]CAA7619440.1 conserved membrane hypothetical protein [Magnetospirillum sp. UT-4]
MVPFMMGAEDRLLPPAIPFGFFAAAVLFHIAGWAALVAAAGQAPGFTGGLGPLVAGLHLITLGVLAMAAMGAAFQILPVATRRRLGPLWACRLTWVLYVPGVALLCWGMAMVAPWALHSGAALTVAGLALFGVLVGRNLTAVDDLPAVTVPAWLALAALAGLSGLGLALVADVSAGFLPDRAAFAAAHAALAGYGFMGLLALGFSAVLLPMFVLAPAVPGAAARRSALLAGLALALGAVGAAAATGWLAALGTGLGLAAVALHLRGVRAVLAQRMRRRLEPFFRLLGLGWAMLPASLVAALALALGLDPERTAPLWGLLLVFGWLLSFVTGMLSRIMPFLASMHSGAMVSRLAAGRALPVHAALHGAALTLLALGLLLPWPPLMVAGAAAGLAGSLAFALFAALVLVRTRTHLREGKA